MDASKLKTRLNGSILKGQKIKIEPSKSKPEYKPEAKEPDQAEPERPKREKRKRKRDEIPGAEIGERSVKRGWTIPGKPAKEDKQKIKSKYTTGKECLFKTALPANVAANSAGQKMKKKKEREGKDTIVHEFEKTTKFPTFLRASGGDGKKKVSSEFVEGKGWVDEDGEVIEPVKGKKRAQVSSPPPPNPVIEPEVEEDTSTSGSSEESDSEEDKAPRKELRVQTSLTTKDESSTSSSGTSEESSSEEEEGLPDPPSTLSTPIRASRPASSSGLTIKIPDSAISSSSIPNTIHPLEALYKRVKTADSTPKPAAESFFFFGADNEMGEDDMAEAHDTLPFTPFTQREFEFRGLRSAAPTPDTAHANKQFLWPTSDSDDDGEEEASSPIRKRNPTTVKEDRPKEGETDFQKWFYEHRGDTSRAWKKRRREVAKEKRQMENRKRGDRG